MNSTLQSMRLPEERARLDDGQSLKEQYVGFTLGGQEYAVEIRGVQEIKGWDSVTRIPFTPSYMLGVVNLRGAIVPVIDLRIRLGLADAPPVENKVIVVLNVPGELGHRTVGMVVDAVAEVHDVTTHAIQAPPADLCQANNAFIKGLADQDGRLLILIDIEKLVRSSHLSDARTAS